MDPQSPRTPFTPAEGEEAGGPGVAEASPAPLTPMDGAPPASQPTPSQGTPARGAAHTPVRTPQQSQTPSQGTPRAPASAARAVATPIPPTPIPPTPAPHATPARLRRELGISPVRLVAASARRRIARSSPSGARGSPTGARRSPNGAGSPTGSGGPSPQRGARNSPADEPNSPTDSSQVPMTPFISQGPLDGDGGPGAPGGGGGDGDGDDPNNPPPHDDSDLDDEEQRNVIWGTSINYEDAVAAFKNFLTTFTLPTSAAQSGSDTPAPEGDDSDTSRVTKKPLYPQIIAYLSDTGGTALNVDSAHLRTHDSHWYSALVSHPEQLVPVFDHVANEVHAENHPEAAEAVAQRRREALHVRCYNLAKENRHAMRSIDPHLITEMVAVRGMVIRSSPVIPDIQKAMYRCTKCSSLVEAEIEHGRIGEPRSCATCNSRDSHVLLHSRSIFADRQVMRLQEAPDQVGNGETPATFTLYVYDALVDAAKPGDRVEITGILRASPVRVNPKMRTVKSVFRTYIDCIHVAVLNNNSDTSRDSTNLARVPLAMGAGQDCVPSEADIAEIDGAVARDVYTPAQRLARERYFEELSCHPSVYQRLADSLAPSIFGMDDEKKGVLLQLFGGASKAGVGESAGNENSTNAPRFRSAINVLLVGDPGTSKSQLLQSAHRLAPRGVYTSGRGSSAVGLTAYVTRDPDTNDFVLESGALVLSDRGLCCIDEFDKMSDFARSVLHEAMEQQTVSIAKAGIVATLNARTSVLAAANPVNSRYDPDKSVVENIDLPPTLLSRFDLIYLVLDAPNAECDRRLAKHIVSLFYKNYEEKRDSDHVEGPASANEVGILDRIDDGINGTDGNNRRDENVEGKTGDGVQYATGGVPTNLLDSATLTEFIAYAREKVDPKLSPEAADALVSGYIDMRSTGRGGASITATPRQLESLIRLAEAHARLHLRNEVVSEDVEEAMRLVREALRSAAFDPVTGKINMDLFAMGATKHETANVDALARAIEEQLPALCEGSADVRTAVLLEKLRKGSDAPISPGEMRDALRELETRDKIIMTQRGQAVRLRLD